MSTKCFFDPTAPPYDRASIGMFHCPECGEMVLSGVPHPDYSQIEFERWDKIPKPTPPEDLQCCYNCQSWHKKDYLHCKASGKWGGKHAMPDNLECVFVPVVKQNEEAKK